MSHASGKLKSGRRGANRPLCSTAAPVDALVLGVCGCWGVGISNITKIQCILFKQAKKMNVSLGSNHRKTGTSGTEMGNGLFACWNNVIG